MTVLSAVPYDNRCVVFYIYVRISSARIHVDICISYKGVRFTLSSIVIFLCYLIIIFVHISSNRGRIAAFSKRAHEPFLFMSYVMWQRFRSPFEPSVSFSSVPKLLLEFTQK